MRISDFDSGAARVFCILLCAGLIAAPGCGPGDASGNVGGATTSTTSTGGAGGDTATTGSGGSGGDGGGNSTAGSGGTGGGNSTAGSAGSGGAGAGGSGGAGVSGGDLLWLDHIGTPKADIGETLDIDAAGDLLIGGFGNGPIDFGGGPLSVPPADGLWAFVARLDQNGNHLWSKRFGSSNGGDLEETVVKCARFDGAGDVIVVGEYVGTGDFGAGQMTAVGNSDLFVLKLDGNGNVLWSKSFGTPEYDRTTCAVDAQGNVLLGGLFVDQIDFGAGPLFSDPGKGTPYLVKLDSDGNELWGQTFSNPSGSTEGPQVDADPAGNVLIAGRFNGQVTIAGQALIGPDVLDLYTGALAPDGTLLWASASPQVVDFGTYFLTGMRSDPAGNMLVTARDLNFHWTVLKYDPSGNLVWNLLAPPTPFLPFDVNADSQGNVLLTGAYFDEVASLFYLRVEKRSPAGEPMWYAMWYTDYPSGMGRRVVADPQDNVVMLANSGKVTDLGGGMMIMGLGGWDMLLARFAQ